MPGHDSVGKFLGPSCLAAMGNGRIYCKDGATGDDARFVILVRNLEWVTVETESRPHNPFVFY
jgi:hypothetical protein